MCAKELRATTLFVHVSFPTFFFIKSVFQKVNSRIYREKEANHQDDQGLFLHTVASMGSIELSIFSSFASPRPTLLRSQAIGWCGNISLLPTPQIRQ